jgi:hypothetical protein
MVRDFMQDILPKDDSPRPPKRLEIAGDEVDVPSASEPEPVPEKSIRNINVNRPRPIDRPPPERPSMDRREVPPVGSGLPRPRKGRTSLWLWIIAGVLLVAVVGSALFMFRSTTITVTPRSHTIVFDVSKTITAYPASNAASGSLSYTVQSFDVDDSQPVASQGTTHADLKASGSVTVVNSYSSASVHLVKTTRFETPDGLIFRAPADITVPGMKGGAPGTVQVTLVADQSGDKYNIGPTPHLAVPGLQGGPMYDKVYAQSSAAFSGGFSGDQPTVAADTRSAAVAEMQGRLKDKVMQQIGSLVPNGGTIFPSFAYVTFQDMPSTPVSGAAGQVNLNERAHVQIPVLPTQDFNRLVAATVSADTENATLTLTPKEGFGANLLSATSSVLGADPITFTLTGSAQLVWGVDSGALAQALAGKDQSAFQTIVNGFPGVQEARARIEPFWSHSFPPVPKDITIVIAAPQEAGGQ